jgi:hypothetical protein
MAQILGYLTNDEAIAFQHYVTELRLDASALANLLIVRELRRARLARLIITYDAELAGQDKKKIVAHQSDDDTKTAFANHAMQYGLKPSRAAAILFRAELHEKWLASTMDLSQFDSV